MACQLQIQGRNASGYEPLGCWFFGLGLAWPRQSDQVSVRDTEGPAQPPWSLAKVHFPLACARSRLYPTKTRPSVQRPANLSGRPSAQSGIAPQASIGQRSSTQKIPSPNFSSPFALCETISRIIPRRPLPSTTTTPISPPQVRPQLLSAISTEADDPSRRGIASPYSASRAIDPPPPPPRFFPRSTPSQ